MIKKYYWDYVVSQSGIDKTTDMTFTKSIVDFFNVELPFHSRYTIYENNMKQLKDNQINSKGVCLSTFHKLKGLEFKNTIIVDLKESIYPNIVGIQSRGYTEKTQESLIEGERRLFYVAVTRAKKKLYFFYDRTDPSLYITEILTSFKDNTKEDDNDVSNVIDSSTVVNNSSVFNDNNDKDCYTYDDDDEDNIEDSIEELKEESKEEVINKSDRFTKKDITPEDYISNVMGVFFND